MSTGHVSYTSRMIKATWVPCEKRERSRIKGSYRTSTVPTLEGERRGSLPLFNYERIHNVESESFSRRIWSLMVIAISSCIPWDNSGLYEILHDHWVLRFTFLNMITYCTVAPGFFNFLFIYSEYCLIFVLLDRWQRWGLWRSQFNSSLLLVGPSHYALIKSLKGTISYWYACNVLSRDVLKRADICIWYAKGPHLTSSWYSS